MLHGLSGSIFEDNEKVPDDPLYEPVDPVPEEEDLMDHTVAPVDRKQSHDTSDPTMPQLSAPIVANRDPDDPFDLGCMDPEMESDSYPPLTPVKALVATAPTAGQILQQACRKAPSLSEAVRPLPYAPSGKAPTASDKLTVNIRNQWDISRREALCTEDLSLLQAMPVIFRLQELPRHESHPYEVVKELRNSVRENGLQASFAINLIEALADSYVMVPADWCLVFKLMLTAGQYSIWLTEFKDLCVA